MISQTFHINNWSRNERNGPYSCFLSYLAKILWICFFQFLLSLLWKIGCKTDVCSSSSSSRKIFCSSGCCFNCINFANRKQKVKPKSWRAKIYAQRTWRRAHVNFAAYFSQSERKIGKKRIHKILAKYDKKQDYGPFFSFLD